MKKIFTLFAAVMLTATTAFAQFEIGGIVGGLNGASAKYWFGNEMAIQADLAVGLTQAAVSGGSIGMWDFTINPNFLYHFGLPANFKVYTGGGINFGMASMIVPAGYSYYYGSMPILGKFGINAVAGVSYDIPSVPLVLAFDFRPGYGMTFTDQYGGSFFDWKLAFAVRYKL